MKNERQKRILELIAEHEIETQEEMLDFLRNEGFSVTQATVSRDLKELMLTKTLTPSGSYRYCVNVSGKHKGTVRLNNAMADSILHVNYSLNNVVLKTYPGLAQAVASSVDAMNMSNVLGCVAGDDTIIIVTQNEESSAKISESIRALMKEI